VTAGQAVLQRRKKIRLKPKDKLVLSEEEQQAVEKTLDAFTEKVKKELAQKPDQFSPDTVHICVSMARRILSTNMKSAHGVSGLALLKRMLGFITDAMAEQASPDFRVALGVHIPGALEQAIKESGRIMENPEKAPGAKAGPGKSRPGKEVLKNKSASATGGLTMGPRLPFPPNWQDAGPHDEVIVERMQLALDSFGKVDTVVEYKKQRQYCTTILVLDVFMGKFHGGTKDVVKDFKVDQAFFR